MHEIMRFRCAVLQKKVSGIEAIKDGICLEAWIPNRSTLAKADLSALISRLLLQPDNATEKSSDHQLFMRVMSYVIYDICIPPVHSPGVVVH